MRLGVYSLQGLIAGSGCSVREGAHYAFTNRPHTLLRTVWFDGTGLCMFSKRLERGAFSWPREAARGKARGRASSPLRSAFCWRASSRGRGCARRGTRGDASGSRRRLLQI